MASFNDTSPCAPLLEEKLSGFPIELVKAMATKMHYNSG